MLLFNIKERGNKKMRYLVVIVMVISFGLLPVITEAGGMEEAQDIQKRYLSGKRHFQSGNYEFAVKQFEQVVDMDPDYKMVAQYLKKARARLLAKSKKEAAMQEKREMLKRVAKEKQERKLKSEEETKDAWQRWLANEREKKRIKEAKRKAEREETERKTAERRAARRKKSLCPFLRGELVIGAEETYVAERNFENPSFPEGDIHFKSLQHLGLFSYELFDGLTLKGKIGSARIQNDSWNYGWHDHRLAWGAGGEWEIPAILPGKIDMIIGGEYFTICSDAVKELGPGRNSLDEKWQEWNGSVAFSRDLAAFRPYIGARVSWAEVKAKIDYSGNSNKQDFAGTLKSEDHVGGFIGTEIDFSKCYTLRNIPFVRDLSLNLEVRAFDELGFTGGLNYNY
jgi:hypothetical protein